MLLFHTSEIEGPILSFWIRYICVAQRKFNNQGLIKEGKNICIVNVWENIIAYCWGESKQSEALADKCDSFHTVNIWWVWGRAAQLQGKIAISTLV